MRFMSSISAESEPSAGTPSASSASRGSGSGWLPSVSTPSASASRRAGLIVITSARRPARAASSAIAAATVVLPTPPQPTQTTTRRSSAGSVTRARPEPRPQPLRELGDVVGTAQPVAQVGQRHGRKAPSPPRSRACGGGSAPHAPRSVPPQAASTRDEGQRAEVGVVGQRGESRVEVGEIVGVGRLVHCIHHDALDRHAELAARAASRAPPSRARATPRRARSAGVACAPRSSISASTRSV